MNMSFWILLIVILILLWFCLSFAFKYIGKIGLRLFDDAKDEILSEENEEKDD